MVQGLLLLAGLAVVVVVHAGRIPYGRPSPLAFYYRGGKAAPAAAAAEAATTAAPELTLEEKVHAAMRKLGLEAPLQPVHTENEKNTVATAAAQPPPPAPDVVVDAGTDCPDGVCAIKSNRNAAVGGDDVDDDNDDNDETTTTTRKKDPAVVAQTMAEELGVDVSLAWAALGATSTTDGGGGDSGNTDRIYHEEAARNMIRGELAMVASVPEDSAAVQQLLGEGIFGDDVFLIRRALAFADGNLDDARAILQAELDELDEAEAAVVEEQNDEADDQEPDTTGFPTVTVDANFDPTAFGDADAAAAAAASTGAPPPPQKKESTTTTAPALPQDVIFEATAAQVFELVLQSPVPVLLDIYADWCGPCKALSPILEEMAVKAGGAFRLVKVNSDTEKAIAGAALQVSALPTIFGIRDGQILNSFQGMPKSQEMMRSFLMGLLIPGEKFDPPVTAAEAQQYETLTKQLIKIAAAAAYPFSARERLQDKVSNYLDDLVHETGDNVLQAEASAMVVRTLLSNVLKEPFAARYRHVNLANAVIAAKVGRYGACRAILKSVGFVSTISDNDGMVIGQGETLVNVAPLAIARDAIDKWIDKRRYELAKAARVERDEAARVLVQEDLARREAAAAEEEDEEDDEGEEDEDNANRCTIKVRLDGKKKIHEIEINADEPIRELLQRIPGHDSSSETMDNVQIICAAKRLILKFDDENAMNKTFRSYGFYPTASLVVKGSSTVEASSSSTAPKLADRASKKLKKKRGTHTMQSVGIYGKDDNAKGELIDGGGGVLYEQDVTDDEEEAAPKTGASPEEETNKESGADVEEQE